ncbi:MAG: hypothetical protein V2J55_02835 [Candidatus Competibacteraceae bacterium]|jgi:ABC-type amino acid transport substrate-binding protein|nr:hypothetical protein [Candidatus Competibacteraceae bacterium]
MNALIIKLLSTIFLLYLSTGYAKEIHMIAPDIPPQIDENGRGRIGDVIKVTLLNCGHTVRFTIVPFGRHWREYIETSYYDGLAMADAQHQDIPGYATEPFHHLQYGAFVVADSDLNNLKTLEDLQNKRVLASRSVSTLPSITGQVPKFSAFVKYHHDLEKIRLLMSGRTDAILGDGLIMADAFAQIQERIRSGQEPYVDPSVLVIFRKLFPSSPQRLYFRDQSIAKDFNRCYNDLLQQGLIDKIARPYVEEHHDVLNGQYPIH